MLEVSGSTLTVVMHLFYCSYPIAWHTRSADAPDCPIPPVYTRLSDITRYTRLPDMPVKLIHPITWHSFSVHPVHSDKIRARILDLGSGAARRALQNLCPKSARILSATFTRTILLHAGVRWLVMKFTWVFQNVKIYLLLYKIGAVNFRSEGSSCRSQNLEISLPSSSASSASSPLVGLGDCVTAAYSLLRSPLYSKLPSL